jgi:hypothetical protein
MAGHQASGLSVSLSQVLNFSVLADAPTTAPPNVGCRRTFLEGQRVCLPKNTTKNCDLLRAGLCRLHLTIIRPHIHIHLVQCKLYGIIPYSLLVGAFQ